MLVESVGGAFFVLYADAVRYTDRPDGQSAVDPETARAVIKFIVDSYAARGTRIDVMGT